MATHSSVLAWRIPEKGEPGGLPSLGSHRVGHDWSDLAAAAAAAITSQVRILVSIPCSTHANNHFSLENFKKLQVFLKIMVVICGNS